MGNDPAFKAGAYALGEWIGKNGHSLVFGGSAAGLMKEVCDGAADNGAKIYGVEPEITFLMEQMYSRVTDKVYTKTLADRKKEMMRLGDAFIALPGGLGTLDEITEIIELNKLGEMDKPVILYNTNNFYHVLKDVFDQMKHYGFLEPEAPERLLISDNLEEIEEYLQYEH